MLGNKIGVLIDEFDFTGSFFAAETEHIVAEKESTVFGADAMTSEPGLASDKLMLRGYYSGYAAGAVFKELRARMGAAGVDTCMALLIDTADANPMAEVSPDAWGKMLKVNLAAPELVTFELNTADAGNSARGIVVYNGVISVTGTTTNVNLGVPGGGVDGLFVVFVQAITGTANNATIVLTSAGSAGGTYLNEGSIQFSAVGGYSVALVGAVSQFVRLDVTSLGGATSFRVVAIACVKGVTY